MPTDTVTIPRQLWADIETHLSQQQLAWDGEEHSVRMEHATLIRSLERLLDIITLWKANGGPASD